MQLSKLQPAGRLHARNGPDRQPLLGYYPHLTHAPPHTHLVAHVVRHVVGQLVQQGVQDLQRAAVAAAAGALLRQVQPTSDQPSPNLGHPCCRCFPCYGRWTKCVQGQRHAKQSPLRGDAKRCRSSAAMSPSPRGAVSSTVRSTQGPAHLGGGEGHLLDVREVLGGAALHDVGGQGEGGAHEAQQGGLGATKCR